MFPMHILCEMWSVRHKKRKRKSLSLVSNWKFGDVYEIWTRVRIAKMDLLTVLLLFTLRDINSENICCETSGPIENALPFNHYSIHWRAHFFPSAVHHSTCCCCFLINFHVLRWRLQTFLFCILLIPHACFRWRCSLCVAMTVMKLNINNKRKAQHVIEPHLHVKAHSHNHVTPNFQLLG